MAEVLAFSDLAEVVDLGNDPVPMDEPSLIEPFEPFDANLAESLSEDQLRALSMDILERYKADKASRKDWEGKLSDGIRKLGLAVDRGPAAYPGASTLVHPVLHEAQIQVWARSIAELWPPSGPVRHKAVGEVDEPIQMQLARASSYMNWQYTELIPDAYDEESALLYRLSLDGSAFKKIYPDPVTGRIHSVFLPAEDVVVAYTATSLRTAHRITHIIRERANDIRKKQKAGFYLDIELPRAGSSNIEGIDEIKDEIVRIEGWSGHQLETRHPDSDDMYTSLEVHCELDLPGYEDPDGIAVPYVVTIDEDSGTIWRIVRNWRQQDLSRERRQYFVHRKFIQGLGFYGYGLLHIAGDLSQAATGALRALLDAASYSNMQGGFKSRDAASKIDAGTIPISPGEWRDVDATSEELAKAFFPLPYKEPSNVLLSLLGLLVDTVRRLVWTMDNMVGDAKNTGPVGTTVALLEAGHKVMSTVHRLQHEGMAEEFRLVAEWNYELLPPGQPYPYRVAGGESVVLRDDFDGRIDIVPVSDPNIFSDTQRMTQAQALMQMAIAPGATLDRWQAERRMLLAMKIDDVDVIQPRQGEPSRLDAISENMAMIYGKPIMAYPDQDHQAHLAVHEAFFSQLQTEARQAIQASYMSHMGDHIALQYRVQMEASIRQLLGPMGSQFALPQMPNFRSAPDKMVQDPMHPNLERMIDRLAAEAAQMMPKPPSSQDAMMAAELEERQRKAALDEEKTLADIRRADVTAAADIRRAQVETEAEIALRDREAEARALRG